MSKLQEINTLQVDQDLIFQERAWRFQRVGRWGIALLLLAALLGVFGAGPVSFASQADAQGQLRLDYERFLRSQADATLSVQVYPDKKHPAELHLWFSREYLNAFRIQEITPLPIQTQLAPDKVVLFFAVSENAQASKDQQPVALSFQFSALKTGWVSGTIGLENGPELHLWHFIYP